VGWGRLTDVLKSGEVLAVGSVLGNLGCQLALAVAAPGIAVDGADIGVLVANTLVEDLEPVT
jgi:hypothetical protein